MDITKLRNICNDYQAMRLISLKNWKHASEIQPRDHAGPYVIAQQGFDPMDFQMTPRDFVLGRSGQWVRLSIFFGLPIETRRQEFVFGTATEVMQVLEGLTAEVRVIRSGRELDDVEIAKEDELNAAFFEGQAAGGSSV